MFRNLLTAHALKVGLLLGLLTQGGLVLADTPWSSLTSKQQELLEPLKNDWDSMSEAQRERWLKVGSKYEKEPEDKQAIMRNRVSNWSQLSPKEKAAARENYKALKEKHQGERNSSWNSYQSLNKEQREEFKNKR
jgi:hypothetical protein